MLSAKSYEAEAETQNSSNIAINIIQQNQESLNGKLIDVDDTFYVFENSAEESVQVIPRHDVKVLETNLGINLFKLVKDQNPDSLTDVIEMNDGTRIASIILDISDDEVQYSNGKDLRRYHLSTEDIYMVHLNNNSISVPYPAQTVSTASL